MTNGQKAFEGSLIHQFKFKKEHLDEINPDDYWLIRRIPCKDFNVFLEIENLERMYVEVRSKEHQYSLIKVYDGRFKMDVLRKLIGRYEAISKI